jgi:hypothetical protein
MRSENWLESCADAPDPPNTLLLSTNWPPTYGPWSNKTGVERVTPPDALPARLFESLLLLGILEWNLREPSSQR